MGRVATPLGKKPKRANPRSGTPKAATPQRKGEQLSSRLDTPVGGELTSSADWIEPSFSDAGDVATWPRYSSKLLDGTSMKDATFDQSYAGESTLQPLQGQFQSFAPTPAAPELKTFSTFALSTADTRLDGGGKSFAEGLGGALQSLPELAGFAEVAGRGQPGGMAVALPPPGGRGDKAAGGRSGKPEAEAEAEPQEAQPLPAAEPLPSAPVLPVPTLASQWLGSDTLAAASLGAAPAPQAQDAAAMLDARARAFSAHAELAAAARARQARMLGDTAGVLDGLRRDHAVIDREARSSHERAVAVSDRHASQQAADIDLAADRAERELEDAHGLARRAVSSAAMRAEGLIDQRIKDAGRAISKRVDDLKSNHGDVYRGKVGEYTVLVTTAVDALNDWSTNRATTCKVGGAVRPMQSAINEKMQAVIPGIAEKRVKRINKEKDDRLKAWDEKNTQALCTTPCSYEKELNRQATEKYEGGRKSVQTALGRARQRLKEMFDEARVNLARQRQAGRAQVFLHQRGLRAQLAGQSQATLAGLQRNAQGSIASVVSAGRTAMPAYWQSLGSLKQSLAAALPAGAAALRAAALESPAQILDGLDASAALSRARFEDGRRQADARGGDQVADLGERHGEQQRTGHATLTAAATEAGAVQTRLVESFREQADSVVEPVRAAGKAYAGTPEQLLGTQFDKAKVDAQAGLSAMFEEAPAGKGGDAAAAACGSCKSAAGGGGGPGGEAGAAPAGIKSQIDEQGKLLKPYSTPATEPEIAGLLKEFAGEVEKDVTSRVDRAYNALDSGIIDEVDEGGVTAALRGMSGPRARAVDRKDYPSAPGKRATLTLDLAARMGTDDESYIAAASYLQGDQKAGAKAELAASQHWYNDQEDRIESTLRALSPTDAQAIGADPDIGPRIRDALGGTDAEVYDALTLKDGGGAVKADAIRMKEKVADARSDADKDAALSGIESNNAIRGEDYNGQQLANLEPEDRAKKEQEHRTAVARELGKLVVADSSTLKDEAAGKQGDAAALDALHEKAAVDFVRRGLVSKRHERPPADKDGRPGTGPWQLVEKKATADLAEALLLEGRGSVKAKAAQIGMELERPVRPGIDKLAETLHDDAFLPDMPGISAAEREQNSKAREQARIRKADVLLMAAEKYAGGEARDKNYKPDGKTTADPTLAVARERLIEKFGERFGDSEYGKKRGELVAGLISEDRPSAKTASLAMQVGMYGEAGTDEALINGMTARMTADEIGKMRTQFRADTDGKDLDEELDSEFSGDDRLENERNLRGLARTEQEKIEAAVFEIRQQRRETGSIGRGLARGSNAEQVLNATERRLYRTLGVSAASFNAEGRLRGNAGLFDAKGQFTGDGRGLLLATAGNTRAAVQAYSATIDRYANAATTSIAIIGAVVGAVLSGGTATPLIVAALASGLTSMAANYAIKGGRYGWEQAGIDLGMTFVQAATAGIGQKLGAAAQLAKNGSEAVKAATRSLQVLSKLFGKNQVINQITIGAITGTFGSSANLIGGMAGAAFDDKTWSKAGGDIVLSLLGGLARGALSGASTASMTQAIEALGRRGEAIAKGAQAFAAQGGLLRGAVGIAGRGLGAGAKFVNTGLKRETGGGFFKTLGALGHRGLAKAATAGVSGMAGRSSELLYDKATGKFKGRIDDALEEIGKAGLQSTVQGFFEGGAEAANQQWRGGQKAKLGLDIAEERKRRGLDPLDKTEMEAAQEELLLLNLHGKEGGGYEATVNNLDRVAANGGLDTRRVGDIDNAPDLDSLRDRLSRDMQEHERKALKDVPIRIADDDAPFAQLDSDRALAALPGLSSKDALLRHVDGAVELVLRKGIGMREVARAGRNLVQAHADGTVQRLIDRNAEPLPPPPVMLPGGGAPRPASSFVFGPDAGPASAATAAEQAIASDALLLPVIGYHGDRGTPGRAQARARLDRSLATLRQANRQRSAGGPLTAAATMRERLRAAWQQQAVFGAAGRARLSVIGELAQGSSPRMRALLGADGPMVDAAARSLLAQYGDAGKLMQMLAIADPQMTPNLSAAAARIGDYRRRLAQALGTAYGAEAPQGRARPGEAIDLQFPGEGGAARRADAEQRMAEQFGPDWKKHFDIAFIDGPGKPKPAPAVEVADDPLSVPLPQEASSAARVAADAAGLSPTPPPLAMPGAPVPTAASGTAPKVQRAILDALADLRLGTVLAPGRIARYFGRHKDLAIARAAAADPLTADFGGTVVAARLKEAWNKQALSGKDGRRRLAVVQELAMANSERVRTLLGSDADAADAAAFGVLRDYGSYEHLMAMLSVGGRELTPAMQACAERILAFRGRVTGALGRAYGAAELGSASKFLNSDVDLSFAGDHAGARLLAAEARMAKAYGADWEKLFTMNFYVEAGRLTAFHDGPDSATRSAAADALTEHTLQAVIGRVLSDVHDNADGVNAVGKMAGLLGVDLDAAAARPDLDREGYKARRAEALLAADKAVQQLRTATTPEQAAELRLKITALTMQANRYSTEAYIGPGAVLLTLKSGGKVTPDLALQSFIGDFENFVHKLYGHGRTVDDGLRDYTTFKYMGRMVEALRAGGLQDPRMAYFEGLAAYLYGGNREGGFESAHVFANPEIYARGKGKAQLSDLPQDDGGSGAVRPEFLHGDLARFMALITDLAPKMRSQVGQHFDPTRGPPAAPDPGQGPGSGPKPTLDSPNERAFAAEKALPKVIVNLPGQPTSEPDPTPSAAKAPMTAAEAAAAKAGAAQAKTAALADLAAKLALPVAFGPATEEQTAQAARAAALVDEAKQAGQSAVKRAAVIARFVELGLDPAAIAMLPDHAYGGALTALSNGTMGPPKAEAGAAAPPPTADQKLAALWAWTRAGGDLGKFASHYEYAVQHYRRIAKRQTEAAGEVADKTFSVDSLDAGLAADVARVAARPRGQALSGPIAALSDQAIHERLRQVENLDFSDPVKEAYHARKHADEIPSDFKGSGTIEAHHQILMDTIRSGELMPLANSRQASGSRKFVIHKAFGDHPAIWREAILYVWPDGSVHLASWGETKAIKRNNRSGRVKDNELNELLPAHAAALRARYAAEDLLAEAAKKDKQRQDSQAKQAQKAKQGQQPAKADQAAKDNQTVKRDQNLKRDKNKKDEGD